MCDYHAPFFGATYPVACCIDGYLWDLESWGRLRKRKIKHVKPIADARY